MLEWRPIRRRRGSPESGPRAAQVFLIPIWPRLSQPASATVSCTTLLGFCQVISTAVGGLNLHRARRAMAKRDALTTRGGPNTAGEVIGGQQVACPLPCIFANLFAFGATAPQPADARAGAAILHVFGSREMDQAARSGLTSASRGKIRGGTGTRNG